MDHFTYRDNKYHCEDVDLEAIAKEYKTPCYVYSRSTIKRHCHAIIDAFKDYPSTICFAVKANSNINLLKEIFSFGLGADVVSKGELLRSLKAGVDASQIMFSGVGKTFAEIEFAIKSKVKSIHVESSYELEIISAIAKREQQKASISLRVNPNIDAQTNPKITTGLYSSKFGLNESALTDILDYIKQDPLINLEGVGCHIGSQITSLKPFIEAAKRMVSISRGIIDSGHPLSFIDFGGGLGIRYLDENPPSPKEYAEALVAVVKPTGLELVLEPGRMIVGNAGVLLTRVTGIKKTAQKNFCIVDAGMNDLMRPALYDARHNIVPYNNQNRNNDVLEVVGPICESTDVFGEYTGLSHVQSGDLLAIRSCGAYGSSLSNTYNSRPMGAEIMIDGSNKKVIARAQRYDEIWQREMIDHV